MTDTWEMVIGIETHVELSTQTKIFCGCPTTFGAPPNTQCCPVCAGLPGALPVLNQKVVDYAVMAGLATGCAIAQQSRNDRKNYFYPDLPKAYQISQFERPLCTGGRLDIETGDGPRTVGITRIHIEEDAGKLVHSPDGGTLIDLNRCGVPLIEIVSEPDMRSADEAVAYLKKLRAVIAYTGVSDVRMNEGSFRADINLSVRKKGDKAMGTRTEMKNLNSFGFVARAIRHEFERQVATLESGEAVVQETRRFDPATGRTFALRGKEEANDYRYFPDPDLLPIALSPARVEALRAAIPALPDARKAMYIKEYGLPAYQGEQLVLDRAAADLFEAAAAQTDYPRQLAALITGEGFRLAGLEEDGAFCVTPEQLAGVATLLGQDAVNSGNAKKLLAALWGTDDSSSARMEQLGLAQLNDEAALAAAVRRVVEENPQMAQDYRTGKTRALKALMGRAMAETGGRANPVLLQALMEKALL